MAGETDQVEGKIEEAAGTLPGDDEQKRDGQIDQLAGKTKSMLGDVADWAADRLKDVSHRLSPPSNHPEDVRSDAETGRGKADIT